VNFVVRKRYRYSKDNPTYRFWMAKRWRDINYATYLKNLGQNPHQKNVSENVFANQASFSYNGFS
jgi:hypothetical protein